MNSGIKEVAEECSLSLNTVSNILNRGRAHLYRMETRDRVIQAAAQLNYQPNRAARSMRSSQVRSVGFLASNMSKDGMLDNYVVYPFLVGMSHYFTERGYHVALLEMNEVEPRTAGEVPEVLRERFFDGLVAHYGVSDPIRAVLPKLQPSIVWWDADIFEESDCIYRDESTVARTLVERLMELGHRRIGLVLQTWNWDRYLSGKQIHFSFRQRYEGAAAALREHGLEPLQLIGYETAELSRQMKSQDVTAVILMGSGDVLPVMFAASRLGWQVPDDLTLVSCDVEARSRGMEWRTGSLLYDRYDAGQRAAGMLHEKIQNGGAPVPTQRLRGDFHPGKTVAGPRGTT